MLQHQRTRGDGETATGPREVTHVRAGTHAFLRYTGAAEIRSAVARYIATGLDLGDRCMYVLGDRSLIELVDALEEGGVDVPSHAADGSLVIVRAQQVFLAPGSFDARRTVDTLREAVRRALADGFVGLRAATEMSWALSGRVSLQELEAYEREVERVFADGRCTGLCVYDGRSGSAASAIERAHSSVLRPYAPGPAA